MRITHGAGHLAHHPVVVGLGAAFHEAVGGELFFLQKVL